MYVRLSMHGEHFLFQCFISHLSTQNPEAAAADKSPDVIPGNEDVDAGPDSVSYDHKLGVIA